jgi:hypothetical protein
LICWKAMNLLVMWASVVNNPFHTTKDVHGNYIVLWIGICYLILQALVCYICASNECFDRMFFQWTWLNIFFVSWASCYLILANWAIFLCHWMRKWRRATNVLWVLEIKEQHRKRMSDSLLQFFIKIHRH